MKEIFYGENNKSQSELIGLTKVSFTKIAIVMLKFYVIYCPKMVFIFVIYAKKYISKPVRLKTGVVTRRRKFTPKIVTFDVFNRLIFIYSIKLTSSHNYIFFIHIHNLQKICIIENLYEFLFKC